VLGPHCLWGLESVKGLVGGARGRGRTVVSLGVEVAQVQLEIDCVSGSAAWAWAGATRPAFSGSVVEVGTNRLRVSLQSPNAVGVSHQVVLHRTVSARRR